MSTVRHSSSRATGKGDLARNASAEPSRDGPSIAKELRRLSRGLLYASSEDHHYHELCVPFAAKTPLTEAHLREALKIKSNVAFVFAQIADFWTYYEDPGIQGEDGPKYSALRAALERNLTDLRYIDIGDVFGSIFLVGRSPDGHLVGLKARRVSA